MPYLNSTFNQISVWKEILDNAKRRVEIDLMEVERLIDIARRTPGLLKYEDALQQLSIFFEAATQYYQSVNPKGLPDLIAFWNRYRSSVIQRYCGISSVELNAADKVVRSIFQRFLNGVPNENIAYSIDAVPLVYGGSGGLGGYFTHPPGMNRPFAIINLPQAAFDNVWQWLALPHETGHDTYATVDGLDSEMEAALQNKMKSAVRDNIISAPDIDVKIGLGNGLSHRIKYSGEELIAKIWTSWANEAQADVIGLLGCGGAAIVALQQIIGFGSDDLWEISLTKTGYADAPEVHPTSYIRNIFNIAALRLLDHEQLANEINARLDALAPQPAFITWWLDRNNELVKIPINDLIGSAELAADLIINAKMTSLGDKSYKDLINFTATDQNIVDVMSDKIIQGDPTFAQEEGSSPRHALAAAMFAFEIDRSKAQLINRTFKHFI